MEEQDEAIQTGKCDSCDEEYSVEPDAEFPCQCGGTVKSTLMRWI